jgi:hypothetical protein
MSMTHHISNEGTDHLVSQLLDAMTTYAGKNDPIIALRVKLTDVLYVPRI